LGNRVLVCTYIQQSVPDLRPACQIFTECFLRVYSGQDGATLFAYPISSNTCLKLPVSADATQDPTDWSSVVAASRSPDERRSGR